MVSYLGCWVGWAGLWSGWGDTVVGSVVGLRGRLPGCWAVTARSGMGGCGALGVPAVDGVVWSAPVLSALAALGVVSVVVSVGRWMPASSSMPVGSVGWVRATAWRIAVVSPTGSVGGRVRMVNAAVSREPTTSRTAAV